MRKDIEKEQLIADIRQDIDDFAEELKLNKTFQSLKKENEANQKKA